MALLKPFLTMSEETKQQAIDQLQQHVGTASASVGTGTAIMGWFDAHAAGVGAICAILTFCVYLAVSIYNIRQKKEED